MSVPESDRPSADVVVDLTNDLSFTFKLLDNTHAWRHRLVEEVRLGDRAHARVSAAYQIEFPPDLLAEIPGGGRVARAKILLPLTTRPKRPLLRFSLQAPYGRSAALLMRSSLAAIQAAYLRTIMESSPAAATMKSAMRRGLFEAICIFTPDVFQHFLANSPSRREAYRRYLTDGMGLEVTADAVNRWLSLQKRAGLVLYDVLREGPEPLSSSEQVLLALPRLEPLPSNLDDIEGVVEGYVTAIQAAADANDEYFLVALAEYGRRWEMIVEVEVPLQEPFQIKLQEAVPIDPSIGFPWRALFGGGAIEHRFALGDARSGHLEVQIEDPHVVVSSFSVRDATGNARVAIPPIESARRTRESLSLYSADADRPYYVRVRVRLQVSSGIRLMNTAVSLLTLVAVVLAVLLPDDRNVLPLLSLLTVPTTFAVALALVRESSALAVELEAAPRRLIGTGAVALWVVAFTQLVLRS